MDRWHKPQLVEPTAAQAKRESFSSQLSFDHFLLRVQLREFKYECVLSSLGRREIALCIISLTHTVMIVFESAFVARENILGKLGLGKFSNSGQ